MTNTPVEEETYKFNITSVVGLSSRISYDESKVLNKISKKTLRDGDMQTTDG
jgi:hypothetical protein